MDAKISFSNRSSPSASVIPSCFERASSVSNTQSVVSTPTSDDSKMASRSSRISSSNPPLNNVFRLVDNCERERASALKKLAGSEISIALTCSVADALGLAVWIVLSDVLFFRPNTIQATRTARTKTPISKTGSTVMTIGNPKNCETR